MAEYRTDKQMMIDLEKERREFYRNEQIRLFGEVKIEDIILDLNYKNKACKETVGLKSFKASQFVRKEGNTLVFKRAIDSDETAIKSSWIKNLRDIEWFINREKEDKEMTDRKNYQRNYQKENYTQVRITINKNDPVDQEIVRYLNRKGDKSNFLKQMILQEIERENQEERTMTVHDKRTNVYHRDFAELIEIEKSVYTEKDALELLDRLDTSRETTYRLPNGIGTWDWRDFISPEALHNGDELILTGEQHCGNKYKLIETVHLAGYDEEDQEFMEMWTEPIGWDNY